MISGINFSVLNFDRIGGNNSVITLRHIHYVKILFAGTVGSFWIQALDLGNFIKLLISSVLFFGIYDCVLLILKEQLVIEIFNQVIEKINLLQKSINKGG